MSETSASPPVACPLDGAAGRPAPAVPRPVATRPPDLNDGSAPVGAAEVAHRSGAGPSGAESPRDGEANACVRIRIDDLGGPEIAALLSAHAALMEALSPPGSCHYLPLDGLRDPAVTVWTAWEDATLLACAALKALGDGHGEVKSMHTAAAQRGRGLGRLMLSVILVEARARGYTRLFLETGAQPAFAPARTLYEQHGFAPCAPFADYRPDPASAFYTLAL